jgi:methylmalonyl-CoA/ethylmalonyl-CoA epimerase
LRFDHIGLFVPDLAWGREKLSRLFPIDRYSESYDDPLIKVRVQFAYDGTGICYELVAPFGDGNPVDGVLKSRKNVLNHVAYRVAALDAELARLTADGAFPLGPPQPAVAFGGARVVFLYTAMNFIIELVEDRPT